MRWIGLVVLAFGACGDNRLAPPPPDGGPVEDLSIIGLRASPLELTPAFSPAIHDYYVRCAAGDNAVRFTITDAAGVTVQDTVLAEDQLVSIRDQAFVRCLPHDFPVITVTTPTDGAAPTPGWYLINTQTFAIVLDTHGTPVWYARGGAVLNVDAPAPDTITYMGSANAPFGVSATAAFEIHDLVAGTTKTVMAVGSPTDGHDFRMLPNGDFLVESYAQKPHVDLSALTGHGADETIVDCEVQEIDPSGALVWSWDASDHLDPGTTSLEPAYFTVDGQTVVDVFHCNAVDALPDGDLLVSLRHANSVVLIDRTTGMLRWKLGGTTGNQDGAPYIAVTGDAQGAFAMQHDARLRADGHLSMFDNHGISDGTSARGVEYALDLGAHTATPVFQFNGIGESLYEGSFRRYDDGHSVIGWGFVPGEHRVVTEVDAAGAPVLEIEFDSGGPTYRAIKVPPAQLDVVKLRAAVARP